MPRRSPVLVKKGRMTQGEKDALANFYMAFLAPKSVRRGATRDMIDEQYPYDLADVEKLLTRGLMSVSVGRDDLEVIGITPQGESVARMILGMTGRQRKRRANPRPRRRKPERTGTWYAYEVGMVGYGGKITAPLGMISGPPGVPLSQLKMEAHKEYGIPYKDVRLRAMLVPGAKWV